MREERTRLINNPLNGRPPYSPIAPVVDTGCSNVSVVREDRRLFESSTGFKKPRYAGCSTDVVSDPVGELTVRTTYFLV